MPRLRRARADSIELGAVGVVLGYSALLNRRLPHAVHVPANLLAALAMLGLARAGGCEPADVALERGSLRRGLVAGALATLVATPFVAGALAHPRTRALFVEDRDPGSAHTAYQALVRIPLGTALAEELVFRGALLGILARRRPQWQAAVISSVLFGVWHVLPTHDSLDRNRGARPVGDRPEVRTVAVAGTVGFTAVAGLGLSWLRLRTRSVLAPTMVHAAVNALAYLGGRAAATRAP